MYDEILELGTGTVIHHGKNSDRIYLLSRGDTTSSELAQNLLDKARQYDYSKIIAKITGSDLEAFVNSGYYIEAYIPNYYPDNQNLFIATYYLKPQRATESNNAEYQEILNTALTRAGSDRRPSDIEASIRQCTPDDAKEMTRLYQDVFTSYPFPIFEEDYIRQTMHEHIDYYCIESEGRLVALASAEMDIKNAAAEMTDFATLKTHRSQGYAFRLLDLMESSTRRKGIKTFFTIARACSFGMNITFAKAGYRFGGRLKNNTNIAGNIESMNIWYKSSVCD